VRDHAAKAASQPAAQRYILAMRLADELDDHLDDAMSYASAGASKPITGEYLLACAALADALQLGELAGEFRYLSAPRSAAPVPVEVVRSESRAFQLSGSAWRSNVFERLRYRLEAWWRA
jgi:hypothetical protein